MNIASTLRNSADKQQAADFLFISSQRAATFSG